MTDSQPSRGASGRLLALSAKLNGAETVETAITRTMELVETAFDRPVASVSTHDPATDTTTIVEAAVPSSARVDGVPDRMPGALVERMDERRDGPSADGIPEATVDADPGGALRAEVLVPVGRDRVLRVGVTDPDGFDDAGIATVEGIAANLETALSRIDHRRSAAVDRDVARALFDRSDDATFVSDTDGTLVAVNRAAVELTGRDRDALLTSGLPDIAGDTAAETVREHLETTVTGASASSTMTLERAHGADRSIELTSQRFAVHGTNYIRTIAHDPPAGRRPQPRRSGGPVEDDATAFRRLNELTAGAKAFDETIERLLSLGCEYFGLETGILSHVDGNEYTIDNVVDATGTHEAGAVYELGETMCDATLAGDATESIAFTDVADTEHRNHPAAEDVHAYIAAPVVVDGDTYGTVNFSMGRPRVNAVDQAEREFVKQIARWTGVEIERRRRFEELERYETILEAVDDPVYALDADGRFTFVNSAAEREFGYDETVLGKTPSIGMRESDLERVRGQIDDLIATDERSKTAEFALETADGGHRVVENRIALLSDDEFRGTAGVLRDVTARNERRQKLESFQRAIEEAVDGVAVLEDGTYTYVDRTHVEMYGFDDTDELLGDTWRKLYDDEEVARLEAEAFPALESEGHWRGMVTGRRPDGSTFPAELSLTIVDDGRLVCTVRDETERQARQRELKLKERAMNEADVGITISDLTQDDNPLIYVNDGFVEQTGYDREEALGRNYRFLEADERDQSVVDDLRNAIAAEEPTTVELRNYRKDGEQFWNRVSMTPVHDDSGDPVNAIGIQQEVTEEKTREKRLQALLGTTRELLEADGLEEVATETVETLTTEFEFHQAAFYRREGDEIVRTAASGASTAQPPGRIERGRTPLWDAIERGKPIHHDDFVGISDGVDRGDVAAGAYFPVGDHGTIVVGAKRPDRLGESQRQLVGVLTENLQSVLDNIQQRRELINEQKRFRMLSESVEEYAFLTIDEDGDIQTWNGGAKNLFGYEADAAVGMSTSKFYPEADRESHPEKRLLQQARVAGESAHEGWLVRADGSEFYADVRYASLEAEDGTFRGFAKIVRDMTRRRHQQRRTERFVEESDDVVTIVDPDGTLTYASGSANRVLGHDPDDLVGENLFDHLHPAGREHAIQQFVTCVEDVERVRAECRFDAPDGGWIDIEGRYRNMLDDDAIEGVIVYLRDVTETKKRIRRFESIFNGTFQLTNLLDLDGTLVEANDATLEFAGVDHDAIVGTPFIDAPLWTHSDAVRDGVRDAIDRAAAGDFVRYETEVRGADGLATVDFSVKPVTDENGDVSELVAEGRDITEQKQHRRHLDVMQRVMRHNMRNDLNKIRGWAQMMVEESDVEKRAERFETVKEVLERWEAMVEKMKSIRSALESQQASDARKEAGSLVRDAVGQAREEEVDVAVVTDAPATESTQVPASPLEAVRELVTNAAEASADPTIEVELTRPEDGWIEISVRDDGPGMPDIEADVLETGEETPLDHGQGLGLWMVRMIVTRAGGDVLVESTADGTDVCLRLPTERAVEDEGSVETTG